MTSPLLILASTATCSRQSQLSMVVEEVPRPCRRRLTLADRLAAHDISISWLGMAGRGVTSPCHLPRNLERVWGLKWSASNNHAELHHPLRPAHKTKQLWVGGADWP